MNDEPKELEETTAATPIQLEWLQPEQLKTSAQLQYDWIELYLTPVTS